MEKSIEKLIDEITNCPYINDYFNNRINKNCYKIIASQKVSNISDFQLPEPWRGEIDKAKTLVISSNPAISEAIISNPLGEVFPRSDWDIKKRINFYNYSFEYYIKDGRFYKMNNNEYKKPVPYWSHIKNQMKAILNRIPNPGVDYCLTEVVHCKSEMGKGVDEAIHNCSLLYLKRILQISPAKLLIIVGEKARKIFNELYKNNSNNNDKLIDPFKIEGLPRMVLFLMAPSAFSERGKSKMIDKGYLNSDELKRLLAHAKSI